MPTSNRALLAAAIAAMLFTAVAVWLVLRSQRTSAPPVVVNEASIMELPPEVTRSAGTPFNPRGPTLVLGKDGLEARLDCDGYRMQRTLLDGRTEFQDLPTTGCELTLGPGSPKPFRPVFPGDEITCDLDADSTLVWCDGSLAAKHAATVTAWSWGQGEVFINGERVGEVPVENIRLPIGRHRIEFSGERARSRWPLTVEADEHIEIFFHAPSLRDRGTARRPDSAQLMPHEP